MQNFTNITWINSDVFLFRISPQKCFKEERRGERNLEMDLPLAVSCATQRKGVSGGVVALDIAGELVGHALVGKFYPSKFQFDHNM